MSEEIKGGVVRRNYMPSVKAGVIDALKYGPLGFPVVDIAAKLIDGSYHTVDSSDMAFQLAGRLASHDGLPQCHPVLLEPIYRWRCLHLHVQIRSHGRTHRPYRRPAARKSAA